MTVKVSSELSKGLSFNDSKFKTSEWLLILLLPVNFVKEGIQMIN